MPPAKPKVVERVKVVSESSPKSAQDQINILLAEGYWLQGELNVTYSEASGYLWYTQVMVKYK